MMQPLKTEEESPSLLDAPIISLLRLDWEKALYLLLIAAAGAMRFWDLGSRALHHDESLHAIYSWYLFIGRGYQHNPMMHGPFQFHGTTLIYFLFGVSDYTARVLPAIFGTLLVALPYFLRDRLGRTGALVTALLLAFSPAMLYYSRFARNDIYMTVWNLGLVICLWRYLTEKRPLYLFLGAAVLAMSFSTKETTFITFSILGGFLLVMAAKELWTWVRRGFPKMELSAPLAFLLLLGSLAAPQFSAIGNLASPLLGLKGGLGNLGSGLVVLFLVALSALIGWRWNLRLWLTSAAVFYALYTLLYTTFFTNLAGFGSGIWGSLDYWLKQQGVERGGQPWYYYLILLTIYEFLPMGASLVGASYQALRRSLGWTLILVGGSIPLLLVLRQISPPLFPPSAAASILIVLALVLHRLRAEPFFTFLVYWSVASFLAYGVAGEKMPWLSLNLALPLILLGGKLIGQFLERLDWRAFWQRGGAYLALLLIVILLALRALFSAEGLALRFDRPPGLQALIFLLVVLVMLGFGFQLGQRLGTLRSVQSIALAFLGVFSLLTLRAAWQASYYHGDIPVEMMVYTQTSPEIPKIMTEIERLARQSGSGKELRITVDSTDGFTWPWAWYLRDYKNVDYPALSNPSGPPLGTVLLLNVNNERAMQPFLNKYGEGHRFRHRWWFPEDYRGLDLNRLLGDLSSLQNWGKWWRYFIYRETSNPLGSSDAILYLPKEMPLAAPAPPQPRAPDEYTLKQVSPRSILSFGRKGVEPSALNEPKGVALDKEGNIYVADSQNHRLQKFDAQGNFLTQVGGLGVGDGQFNEPWGVAVDVAGNVYVADTWNHRIQKFDPNLRFLAKWGEGLVDNKGQVRGNEGKFYGPREIAIDAEGNLYVTDTGNKRVQKFDPAGRFLDAFGGQGSGPGQFQEPVGIDIDHQGNIFVADTWNRRIQRFDKDFRFLNQIPVHGWESTGVLNKPYLATDPEGNILVTDPENHRLLRFSPSGELLSVIGKYGSDQSSFSLPIGIATDAEGNIYVSEAGNHRIQKFAPLK